MNPLKHFIKDVKTITRLGMFMNVEKYRKSELEHLKTMKKISRDHSSRNDTIPGFPTPAPTILPQSSMSNITPSASAWNSPAMLNLPTGFTNSGSSGSSSIFTQPAYSVPQPKAPVVQQPTTISSFTQPASNRFTQPQNIKLPSVWNNPAMARGVSTAAEPTTAERISNRAFRSNLPMGEMSTSLPNWKMGVDWANKETQKSYVYVDKEVQGNKMPIVTTAGREYGLDKTAYGIARPLMGQWDTPTGDREWRTAIFTNDLFYDKDPETGIITPKKEWAPEYQKTLVHETLHAYANRYGDSPNTQNPSIAFHNPMAITKQAWDEVKGDKDITKGRTENSQYLLNKYMADPTFSQKYPIAQRDITKFLSNQQQSSYNTWMGQ